MYILKGLDMAILQQIVMLDSTTLDKLNINIKAYKANYLMQEQLGCNSSYIIISDNPVK